MTNSRPLISFIVPTHNSDTTLNACLKAIKNQTYKNIEIIVVDNCSLNQTKTIAKKFTHFVYEKGPERSAQRNYGAKKSRGEYLIFIDSDMVLSPKVAEECIAKIQSDHNLHALVIPEESVGIGFWAECKRLERSFYVGVSWLEAARFFRRTTFNKLDGYDENNTGTEDYDLPQRLVASVKINPIGRIDSTILHDEGRLTLSKTLSKKFYYSKKLNTYKESHSLLFNKQSSIFERYKLFFSKPFLLMSKPHLGLGMLFMKTCEFCAGGIGYLVN